MTIDGVELLPSATSSDWATYADNVVNIHVDNEGKVEPSAEELEAGEGIVGRTVTVTVTDVLWKRPNTSAEQPKAMTWSAGGWAFKGTAEKRTEKELVQPNAPVLTVGHDYLVAVTLTPVSLTGEGPSEWIPLGGTAMLPFDDGVVGRGETISQPSGETYRSASESDSSPMRDSLWDKSGALVESTLETMKPYPEAAKYWAMNPVQRYQAVLADTTPSQSPGPGEPR